MKKTILLFSLLILFAISKVCSQSATLTVFSQDGEKFWVIMNGIKQNSTPMTNVKVTGLSSPNYRLKIIFEDENITSIDKNVMTRDVDNVLCDQSYVVKKDKKGRFQMRLNSFEPVKTIATTVEPNQIAVPFTTEEPKGETPTQANTNNERNPTQVQQTTVTTTQTNQTNAVGMNVNVKDEETGEGVNMNMNVSENGIGMNIKDPETGEGINMNMNVSETGIDMKIKDPVSGEGVNVNMNVDMKDNTGNTQTTYSQTTTTTTTTSYGHNQREPNQREPKREAYKLPGYNGPTGCEYPMSSSDFNDAKSTITSKTFEDSKMTIAKQITSSNCLLTSQVKDIMLLFSFEDTKLEFAKYAYNYTFDIGNYYKVNDAFTFEMTIDELNAYISTQKR